MKGMTNETQRRILDCVRERDRLSEQLAKLPTNSYTPRRGAILRAIGEANCAIARLTATEGTDDA